MEKIIISLVFIVILLFLLFVSAVLFIINILKTKNDYTFNFKTNGQLYNLAFKDDLTNLFNRNAYIRDLRKFEKKKFKSLCFSIFDIDDFKTINDTTGHLFGDQTLISASNRLRKIFESSEHSIYRIGGDEFLVISKDISENDLIKLFLELKKEEIKNCDFRFSKGYSFVAGNKAIDFEIAFDSADQMLYADKKSKKKKLFHK